jgi:hypothetical protein
VVCGADRRPDGVVRRIQYRLLERDQARCHLPGYRDRCVNGVVREVGEDRAESWEDADDA